jgi:hypothetical protein
LWSCSHARKELDALKRADAQDEATKNGRFYKALMALKVSKKCGEGFPQIIAAQSAATDRRAAWPGVFSTVISTCLPHAPPAGNGHHWPWYRLPGPMAFVGVRPPDEGCLWIRSAKSAPYGFQIDDIAAQDPASRPKGSTGVFFGQMDEPVHLIDENAGGRDFLK